MGRGGDPNSFRPARDESQYWCRRDALVRCVTAFLFGPSGVSPRKGNSHASSSSSSSSSREMILIFDDDRAQIHLSLADADSSKEIIPSEQVILSLFKQAAQSLNQTVTNSSHGLICRTVMDLNNQQRTSNTELPSSGLDSKRHVLEYLQEKCSIDFLRNHGLNSSTSVILRKSNKKTLMEVWKKWQQEQQQVRGATTTSTKSDPNITESLFHEVIQSFQNNGASKNELAIVGTLHESGEEFPCFVPVESGGMDQTFRIMLFLGAVRDMTVQENRILEKVCHKIKVPRVAMRFSIVSEFTSKILSVLAFHQSHPTILKCALRRLLAASPSDNDTRKSTNNVGEPPPPPPPRRSTCLHVISQIPVPSSAVSAELTRRDRIHWCLVRVVVCTLWRSRLASSDNTVGHQNTLTLIFEDGVTLYLQEGAFVNKLASQHQAAPSEHQILAAIRSLLDSEQQPPLSTEWSKKKLASSVVEKILSSSSQAITSTISIDPTQQENSISKSFFYRNTAEERDEVSSCRAAILVLDVHKSRRNELANNKTPSKMHRAVLTAVSKRNIPTISTSIARGGGDGMLDYEASNITCLQHFLYQNRLFVSQSTSTSGKKRKASG